MRTWNFLKILFIKKETYPNHLLIVSSLSWGLGFLRCSPPAFDVVFDYCGDKERYHNPKNEADNHVDD